VTLSAVRRASGLRDVPKNGLGDHVDMVAAIVVSVNAAVQAFRPILERCAFLRPPAVRLAGGLLSCVLYQAFLVFSQGRPDPQACGGSERTLAGMPVKGEEPSATHRYGCGYENKVVAIWAKGQGKAAGQALGLLKGLGPVNRFQAEAYALGQVGKKLAGSAFLAQQDVEHLDARQGRETDDFGVRGQEPLDSFAVAVVQVEVDQHT